MEHIKEIAKKIANDYPIPPTTITESDMRAMLENAAMQMYEGLNVDKEGHAKQYVEGVKSCNEKADWGLLQTAWIAGCTNLY